MTPELKRKSRWLAIPAVFGSLLVITLFLRWLPAAIERAQTGFGLGQVIGGNLLLAWQAALRAVVALIITLPALPLLPPIGWRVVFLTALAALAVEVVGELMMASLFGVQAGQASQLVATAIGFSVVLTGSAMAARTRLYHAA